MMTTKTALANRLKEVLLEGHWIANTNYMELIRDLSLEEATAKVGNLNTIAALLYHINYYLKGILNVFEGGDLEIRDKYSFDMPTLSSSADWQNLIHEFRTHAESFVSHVDTMSEEHLQKPFVDEKYGNYRRNIEGVIEHSYYHMGQISLLKKMILKK